MALTEHSPRTTLNVRRAAQLATGDALAFLVFAAIGTNSHGEGLALLHIVEVAAPFAIGWALVAPWTGAYRDEYTIPPRAMAARTALTWVLALPIGLLLRGLITQKVPPLSFAVITLLTLAILLVGWRGVFAWLTSRKRA